jgi:hypothetical protein
MVPLTFHRRSQNETPTLQVGLQTWQAYLAEEAKLDEYLAEDDKYNLTDEHTVSHEGQTKPTGHFTPQVASLEGIPTLYQDLDSVCTSIQLKLVKVQIPHNSQLDSNLGYSKSTLKPS